jgi:tripartite-type tricarboxylate transporter receptor subunit TctC
MQRRTFFLAAGAALAAPVALAHTASWPGGPVRLVVGFPAGGGTDLLARLLGEKLAARWGAPVVVENKAGASGTIAAAQVAKAAPDGRTLLMAHISSHGIAPGLMPRTGFDAERDFSPIGLVGTTPQVLLAGPGQGVKTLAQLVALCRSRPGKVTFGSAGNGSAQHLALELFKAQARVEVLHVPYKGSAPMVTDMLGGLVHFAFEGMTTALPYVRSGRLAALAQSRSKRSPSLPDVPTVAEQGFPAFDAGIWFGLVGPAALPGPLVGRINADLNEVLRLPDIAAKLSEIGAEDGGGPAPRFGQFMQEERRKWAQIIRAGNITPDS